MLGDILNYSNLTIKRLEKRLLEFHPSSTSFPSTISTSIISPPLPPSSTSNITSNNNSLPKKKKNHQKNNKEFKKSSKDLIDRAVDILLEDGGDTDESREYEKEKLLKQTLRR